MASPVTAQEQLAFLGFFRSVDPTLPQNFTMHPPLDQTLRPQRSWFRSAQGQEKQCWCAVPISAPSSFTSLGGDAAHALKRCPTSSLPVTLGDRPSCHWHLRDTPPCNGYCSFQMVVLKNPNLSAMIYCRQWKDLKPLGLCPASACLQLSPFVRVRMSTRPSFKHATCSSQWTKCQKL